jgi:hypothetical protein
MSKIVFISYAHTNRDEYLDRFVNNLAHEVLMHLVNTTADDVAFFDAQRIETGEYWRDKLANELVGCKACVAICSPAFAASHFCGKELRVFLDRVEAWKDQGAAGQTAQSPVFPVVWIGAKVPLALTEFQNAVGTFPAVYAEKGLRTMYALGKYAQRRKEVLLALAEWIADAVKHVNLPPRLGIPDFDFIPSLFHDVDTPVRHGVAMVPLLHGGVHAQPFGDGRTLGSLVEATFGAQVPWRVLEPSADLPAKLTAARDGQEVTLVVTDLPTLADPLYAALVRAVDAELSPPAVVAVLRASALGSPADEQNAELTVASGFAHAGAAGIPIDTRSIRTSRALEVYLSQTVLALRKAMITELQPVAASDPTLAAAAGAAGVPIDRQPAIVGPGGNAP